MASPARVGIFGTGTMAKGMARLCLGHGLDVVVASNSEDRARRLREELLEHHADRSISADASDLAGCRMLLEGTVEDAQTKKAAFRRLEPILPADALIATTTSSLSITDLASSLAAPDRFIGLHFFNPVHRMRLVEVVGGLRSSKEALVRGREFVESIGKRPLQVADRAGFLVNRLLFPYLNQATRLVESGFAQVEDIDTAMRLGAGHPMGPFQLIDLVGADVTLAISRSLFEEYGTSADAPSPGLRRRVALGLLGRKTGRGYYEYPRKRG